MFHFWNVYEVPTFQMGLLSAAQPRLGIMTSVVGQVQQQIQQRNGSPRNAQQSSGRSSTGRSPLRPSAAIRQVSEDWETPPHAEFNGRVLQPVHRTPQVPSSSSGATMSSDRSSNSSADGSNHGRSRSNSANSHRPVINIYESVEARRVRLQAAKDNENNLTRSPQTTTRASSNPNTPYQSTSSENLLRDNKPPLFPSFPPSLNNPAEGNRRPRSSSEGYAPAWSMSQPERQKSSDSNDDYGFFDDGDATPKTPEQSTKFVRNEISYNSFGYESSSKFTIFGNCEEDN